jgi:hypothetical protein
VVYEKSVTVPDGWEVALSTHGDGLYPGPLFADVQAKVADVTGDGKDELLVGYRSSGTGQFLDYDLVGTTDDGTPTVEVHERLDHGSVVVRSHHLVTYSPVYGHNDANCCPHWIRRDTVGFSRGAFVLHLGPKVLTKKAKIPPSQL